MKAHTRRHRDLFMTMLSIAEESEDDFPIRRFLHDTVFTVTASDARGFWEHCGYL